MLPNMTAWVLFWVLVERGAPHVAPLVGLMIALAVNASSVIRGHPKALEIGTASFFAGFGLASLVVDPAWLERWAHVMGSGALALTTLVSLAVSRPLVMQYARERVPRDRWDSSVFVKRCAVITWVWFAAFAAVAIAACVRVYRPEHSIWSTRLVPAAALAAALVFTAVYPKLDRRRLGT